MTSLAFGVPTAYDKRLLAIKQKKQLEITLLNVSKCSVPRICDELRKFNRYDETCETEWKQFKEIETSLWLADHRQREAEKTKPTVGQAVPEETKETPTEPPPAPPTNRGNNGPSKYGGTVPLPDWAWSAMEEQRINPDRATVGLSFQDIQNYSLFELRQSMIKYNVADTSSKADEHYKACESLMVKLVKLLADPKANRVQTTAVLQKVQTESTPPSIVTLEEVTTDGFVVLDSPTKTTEKSTTTTTAAMPTTDDPDPNPNTTASKNAGYETSSDGKQVRVRRGTEITYDNCPTLSIYELRQELVRRNNFDEFLKGKKKINFNNMLNVLQSLILKDRYQNEEQRAEELWEKPKDIKARLLKAKTDRKTEALERSAVRQAQRMEEEKRIKLKEEREESVKEESGIVVLKEGKAEEGEEGEQGEQGEQGEGEGAGGGEDKVDEVEPALWEKRKSKGLYF